jgi:hypothetical protein
VTTWAALATGVDYLHGGKDAMKTGLVLSSKKAINGSQARLSGNPMG